MGRSASLILSAIVCGVALSSGCKEPQPQLLVVIDTDLVLPRQLAADPSLSPGASFDRLTIEMLTEAGDRLGFSTDGAPSLLSDVERTIPITTTTPWPVTFGVRASDEGHRAVRMRIRAYRADSVSYLSSVRTASERLTLDRLVVLTVPAAETETVRVVLAGDCFGTPSDPEASFQTCLTDPNEMRDAAEGVERLPHGAAIPATVAGTWARARAMPCTSTPQNSDAVCVPSGLFVRGDENFEDYVGDYVSSFPRHLVHLRPFFLDRREFTVRRFRTLLARGVSGITLPTERSSDDPRCTWSAIAADLEDHPLNCVTPTLARAVCQAEGGDLPTDAQWEHAARGRRIAAWVWGNQQAACCAAWIGAPVGCDHEGPTTVGTFADPSRCEGRADVSTDGILDLAGNVRELVRDSWVHYGASECPRAPIAEDPLCVAPRTRALARGGSFRSTFDQAKIAARSSAVVADDVGFRCAYAGVPQ